MFKKISFIIMSVMLSLLILFIPVSVWASSVTSELSSSTWIWLLLMLCFPLGLLLANDDENASLKLILAIVVASIAFWLVSSFSFSFSFTNFDINTTKLISHNIAAGLLLHQMLSLIVFISIVAVACVGYWQTGRFLLLAIFIGGALYPANIWLLQQDSGWLLGLGVLDMAGGLAIYAASGCLLLAFALQQKKDIAQDNSQQSLQPISIVLLGLGIFGAIGASVSFGSTSVALDNVILLLWLTLLAGVLAAATAVRIAGEPALLQHILGGGLAAMVAYSASVGVIQTISALVIGTIAGALFAFSFLFFVDTGIAQRNAFFIALCAISGLWGSLAAGMFFDGDIFNTGRILIQLIGMGILCLSAYLLGRIAAYKQQVYKQTSRR